MFLQLARVFVTVSQVRVRVTSKHFFSVLIPSALAIVHKVVTVELEESNTLVGLSTLLFPPDS